MKQQLYAFWRYDKFPYVLGSEVVSMNDNGSVKTKGYGGSFKPIKILPLATGLKMQADLDLLKGDYENAIKAVTKNFEQKLAGKFEEAMP